MCLISPFIFGVKLFKNIVQDTRHFCLNSSSLQTKTLRITRRTCKEERILDFFYWEFCLIV